MPTITPIPHLSRRRFFQWSAALTFSAGAAVAYTRLIEPNWLSIEKVEIPIKGLPTSLDGTRIAQLSDIHLSQYFSPDSLASALSRVEQLAPDCLVLTGDFVGRRAIDAEGLIEPLRALSMPIYAVYGNHDLWSDRPTVTRCLHESNVNVLLNDAIRIASGLWIAGVDDLWSGHPDVSVAMHDIPPGATTLLLAHEPDFFDIVLHEDAPIALQMSGHTHGGQVRLPTATPDATGLRSYAPILPQYGRRYPIGLRHINDRFIYTNRGLGVWPMPYRWNCRPELTQFTLRSA